MSVAWESTSNNNHHPDRSSSSRYQPVEVFSSNDNSYALNETIKTVCKDLLPSLQRLFLEFPTDEDKELVADYLLTCMHQENITLSTKKVYLLTLFYLSRHFNHKKSFKEMMMSSNDITDYLGSLHKDRALDPDQGWINTHNQRAMVILKFFKWIAFPQLSSQERKKLSREQLPPVLRSLTFMPKRGSRSPVKAKDIWTDQDTAIFLKYCAGWNPRLACFHAMARDTSARPGEILARGGSDHKEEVRARVIRIRQETYDRLKNSKFAGFGMDFDDVVTKTLDRLDELERRYAKEREKRT